MNVNKKTRGYVLALSVLMLTAGWAGCSKDTPGAMEDQPVAVKVLSLDMSKFSAAGEQTMDGIENGIYRLDFYGKTAGTGYVEANGRMTATQTADDVAKHGCIAGINVSEGKCVVKIVGETVSNITNIRLTRTDKVFSLIKGGDISELTYVEQNGGKYYDEAGTEGECLSLLKSGGMNLVRLRLYNDPGKKTYKGYDLPAGIQDEDDILKLAERAKKAGMAIMLTFHYSDFWTNGEDQYIPHQWSDGWQNPDKVSRAIVEARGEELRQKVYDFTYNFMKRLRDEKGITPEFVSIGNETQAGMLYPIGGPLSSGDSLYQVRVKNVAAFYNAGHEAVKAISPNSRTIIHLNGAGEKGMYTWYLGMLRDRKVSYDIIGSSYYPYWTERDVTTVCNWANDVTTEFDKDLIFMETAYAWSKTIEDGTDGQLTHNNPYTDMSVKGQREFMAELNSGIKAVKNQRLLGYVYWDPIFIPAGTAGWAVGEKNVVSNSALFGFDGKMLPVWDTFKYNN